MRLAEIPGLEMELICLPEFQWKHGKGITTWDRLWRISSKIPLIRRARFLIGQVLNPLRAIRHAVAVDADLIHFADFNHLTFPLWRRSLIKHGIPIVLSAHDVRRQKEILNRSWETRQLKAVYRFAAAILVHSKVQAEELCAFVGDLAGKITIVPHGPYDYGTADRGLAEIREAFGLPLDRQLALFFGQVRDEKNLDALIEALSLSSSSVHLLVAGRGGGKHRSVSFYRALAVRLGLTERVHFLDRYIADQEVPALFAACDWVALPYSKRFTSQSGVLAIAAHYAKPMLASAAPVIEETVRNGAIGVVCGGDSAQSLAAGIDEITEFVDAGHQFHFDEYASTSGWRDNARITFGVYQKVVEANRRRRANPVSVS